MTDLGTEMRIAGLRKENARAWAEVEKLRAVIRKYLSHQMGHQEGYRAFQEVIASSSTKTISPETKP